MSVKQILPGFKRGHESIYIFFFPLRSTVARLNKAKQNKTVKNSGIQTNLICPPSLFFCLLYHILYNMIGVKALSFMVHNILLGHMHKLVLLVW